MSHFATLSSQIHRALTETIQIEGNSGTQYSFRLFYSEETPFPAGWDFEQQYGIFLYTRTESDALRILGYVLSFRIFSQEEFHRIQYLHPGKQADQVYFLPLPDKATDEAIGEDLPVMNLMRLYTCG
jgi:hypothetical protein